LCGGLLDRDYFVVVNYEIATATETNCRLVIVAPETVHLPPDLAIAPSGDGAELNAVTNVETINFMDPKKIIGHLFSPLLFSVSPY
jgi:hypothetical protein